MQTAPSLVSPSHVAQFRDEGYFVLESIMPHEHVELFRAELAASIDHIHREMDRLGTDVIGINHRNKRYFIMNRYRETGRLATALFSDYMAEICRAVIGPDAYLINEQYSIKYPGLDTKFSWHQDSGYVSAPHRPWVTT